MEDKRHQIRIPMDLVERFYRLKMKGIKISMQSLAISGIDHQMSLIEDKESARIRAERNA